MPSIVRTDGPKRQELPQIPKDKTAEFARYLQTLSYPERRDLGKNGMGNQYNVGRVPDTAVTANKMAVKHLKPTQGEIDAEKVQGMMSDVDRFKKDIYFASVDNDILDGHHRLAAVKHDNPNNKVTVIKANIPIKDLIQAAHEFSGSHSQGIAEMIKLRDLVLEVKITPKLARLIATKLGVENEVDLDQLRRGMDVEQEHVDTIRSLDADPTPILLTVARIAIDHLRELPDYYTRLDKMEKVTTR